MTVSVLADENVNHRVVHRLEHYGVDVVHVDLEPTLEKGCSDAWIAEHSLDSVRSILTNDDDFFSEFSEDEVAGVLFIQDGPIAPSTVPMSLARSSPPSTIRTVESST